MAEVKITATRKHFMRLSGPKVQRLCCHHLAENHFAAQENIVQIAVRKSCLHNSATVLRTSAQVQDFPVRSSRYLLPAAWHLLLQHVSGPISRPPRRPGKSWDRPVSDPASSACRPASAPVLRRVEPRL